MCGRDDHSGRIVPIINEAELIQLLGFVKLEMRIRWKGQFIWSPYMHSKIEESTVGDVLGFAEAKIRYVKRSENGLTNDQ